jgi:3-oxoacyl-[acyl-carrier-protein] synthase-3
MKAKFPLRIVSMGKYLPKKVSSAEIEEKLGIPNGWAKKYSGVESRHQVTFEHNDYMGARAAERALEKANMSLGDIDMIIAAGGSFDYIIPNQASVIKNEMKDGDKFHPAAIDVDSTCLSFLAALNMSSRMLDGDQYKNILIVSTEISSKHLDPSNWETSTLFGDASVAAVVQHAPESESCLIKGGQRTYSKGVKNTIIEGGGLKHPFSTTPYDVEMHSFKMQGKQLLRMAKNTIPEFMNWFFQDLPYTFESVPVIIPHQASKMGLVITESLYDLKEGQMKTTLSKYGNCIAASIPLTLHDCIESGELKRGDVCLLSGTSAGFSIGAILLEY